MAYVVTADIFEEDLEPVSTHQFWGATAKEAQKGCDDFMAACPAMQAAEAAGLLEISEPEEIGDDELPEITEEEDAGQEVTDEG
jgi:hypothetical protein